MKCLISYVFAEKLMINNVMSYALLLFFTPLSFYMNLICIILFFELNTTVNMAITTLNLYLFRKSELLK